MVCNTFYERGGFSAPLPPRGLLRGDAAFCQPSFSRSVQHQLCDSSRESLHMEFVPWGQPGLSPWDFQSGGGAGLGGVKGKELFAPNFPGVQGKIPGQRKYVFPFWVKQFLCFKTYTEGPKNSEFYLFVALKF